MDSTLKNKISEIQKIIRDKKYQQALDQLEVFQYKYPKVYQGHLMLGLCYQKTGQYQKAQNAYLQVLSLKQDQPNAIKCLCEIYSKLGNRNKTTEYLEKCIQIFRGKDINKYKQSVIKLIQEYKKQQNLQKIYGIFQYYINNQKVIGQDFVKIGQAYFQIGVINKCFNLQQFQLMGRINEEQHRIIQKGAKQPLNNLLIQIINFLNLSRPTYNLQPKAITNSIFEMKYYFPDASCLLMLFLLDQFAITQIGYSQYILKDIQKLLKSFYDGQQNLYTNIQYTASQIFAVSMILSYQYLTFFRQFFNISQEFVKYIDRLGEQQQEFIKINIRESYSKNISNNILRECRLINRISENQNIQKRLTQLNDRVNKLKGSYLQQVLAKMAMNCFGNYRKLDDMKNLLKIRIKNSQNGQVPLHLYKYYFDYLYKIAKIFKILDQEISIYDVINAIVCTDPDDLKYQLYACWLRFSVSISQKNNIQKIDENNIINQQTILQQNQHENLTIKDQLLNEIKKLQQYIPKLTKDLKSEAYRKMSLIKMYLGIQQNLENDLKNALGLQRSLSNLQVLGVYYFQQKRYDLALVFLKEAFIINQSKYHLNRLIFICLIKCNNQQQAYDFLQRIYEGFNSVFWINYILAIKKINQRKIDKAQKYLSQAIEIFDYGRIKETKASYQKTIEGVKYSFLYMIHQNQFHIIYDQVIVPQSSIKQVFQMATFSYHSKNPIKLQIKLWTQIGQLLKILGRTKSAYNYLIQGYTVAEMLPKQMKQDPQLILQICLLKKQYATVLFYLRFLKQSIEVLSQSRKLLQKLQQNQLKYQLQSQINALSFQISLQKLTMLIKFDSYQSITTYLSQIQITQIKNPSVSYLKSKYQFHILCYLHYKNNIQKCWDSISMFLSYFGLKHEEFKENCFENRVFELNFEQRKLVRECLQDFMVLKYINNQNELNPDSIMPLIQLFPQSSIFYIVYGMAATDLRRKISSFLKCIQIDKESPISIDLLGSLYLKQKNYLGACKLFLKSLQINMLNPRCYLGLCVSLFALITRSLGRKDSEQVVIIQKCFSKINSYMQYLRCTDPSPNYQLLTFYKLLLNDKKQPIQKIKNILDNCQRIQYSKQSILNKLLQQSLDQISKNNIWKEQQVNSLIQTFIQKIRKDYKTESSIQLAKDIIKNLQKQVKELIENKNQLGKQLFEKRVLKILNQICISLNLAKKQQFNENYFFQIISLLKEMEKVPLQNRQETISVQKTIKEYLYGYLLLNYSDEYRKKIQQIYPSIDYYNYIIDAYTPQQFQRYLSINLLRNPSNEYLNKLAVYNLIINHGKHLSRNKFMDYRAQILNDTLLAAADIQQKNIKKLIMLYRDPNAWLALIQLQWRKEQKRTQQNTIKWLNILNQLPIKKKKLSNLKICIYSYASHNYGYKNQNINLTKQQQQFYENLLRLRKFYQNTKLGLLKQICINQPNEQIAMLLYCYIINKYKPTQKLESLLSKLQQKLSKYKGYILLLRLICILSKRNQQQILKKIQQIQYLSQQLNQKQVDPITIALINCLKYLLMKDFNQLDQELGIACQRFTQIGSSDTISLNYFQVLRAYHQVEMNQNQNGSVQNFMIFVSQLIELVKEPYLKGFFLYLKGMIQTMMIPQGQSHLVTDLKKAVLLSPTSCRRELI